MSHLENIATRQRQTLVRDSIFAALLVLATIVSASTVGQAVRASAPAHNAPIVHVAAR